MKMFKFFLVVSMGCLALGVWARLPQDAGAKTEASAAQRLSEHRRAELRAALKASQAQLSMGAQQEVLDYGRALSDQERALRRQQLRQQLREINYDAP